jgi:hypothetical protein
MKTTVVLATVAVGLFGCSSDSWLYPTFSISDQHKLVESGAKLSSVPSTVDDARNLVIGLTAKLDDAARHRNDAEIVARELLFYGSLIAVGGVAASSIALRNVGAGIAAGSIALDHHYQSSVQESAFRKASQRMRCARDLLDPIDPALLDALPAPARNAISDKTMADYSAVPRNVSNYVDRVSQDLRAALAAVTLSTPSQQDLLASFSANNVAKQHADLDTKNLSKDVSTAIQTFQKTNDTVAVAAAAKAAAAATAAAKASQTLLNATVIQGVPLAAQSDIVVQAAKAADEATAEAALATSAVSAAAPPTTALCVEPSESTVASPSDWRQYRACLIRRQSAESQGQLTLAFGQAVGTLPTQLELCLKTNPQ